MMDDHPNKTYEWLNAAVDRMIQKKRERLNKESCAAGQLYAGGKPAAPAVEPEATTPPERKPKGNGKDPKGKGKDKKGKGKGKDEGNADGDAKKKDGKGGKKHVDAEGRPLRCVNFWFGCCKNHPLKEGENANMAITWAIHEKTKNNAHTSKRWRASTASGREASSNTPLP